MHLNLLSVSDIRSLKSQEASPDSRRLRSGIESILRDQEAMFYSYHAAFVASNFIDHFRL